MREDGEGGREGGREMSQVGNEFPHRSERRAEKISEGRVTWGEERGIKGSRGGGFGLGAGEGPLSFFLS